MKEYSVLTGLAMLALLLHKQGKEAALSVAPPLFTGTFLFVGFMVMLKPV